MTAPFAFGYQSRALRDRAALRADARLAESLGYRDFFTHDHLGSVDPFVPLVVAAEATSRLRIGPLVLNNEFHEPALLARTAATVDLLSGGRLTLGLGTGYDRSEHDAAGIELRPPGARVDRFEESVIALRALLDVGRHHHRGDHVRLAVDDLGVRPAAERVPLLVGGHGRRVVELAARHADIVQFTGLTHGADGTPTAGGFAMAEVVRRHEWIAAVEAERVHPLERSVLVQVSHVGAGAQERATELAAQFGVEPALLDETPFVLVGSVEQVIDKVERLREVIGVTHFVIRDAAGFAPVVEALTGR